LSFVVVIPPPKRLVIPSLPEGKKLVIPSLPEGKGRNLLFAARASKVRVHDIAGFSRREIGKGTTSVVPPRSHRDAGFSP